MSSVVFDGVLANCFPFKGIHFKAKYALNFAACYEEGMPPCHASDDGEIGDTLLV